MPLHFHYTAARDSNKLLPIFAAADDIEEEETPGVTVAADYPEFSGFIFKMQANLDPQHRDRLAYVRVVSGKYEKGMKVKHSRSKR